MQNDSRNYFSQRRQEYIGVDGGTAAARVLRIILGNNGPTSHCVVRAKALAGNAHASRYIPPTTLLSQRSFTLRHFRSRQLVANSLPPPFPVAYDRHLAANAPSTWRF
jgi:hypothetical protein